MSLSEYHRKRRFGETSEPEGEKGPSPSRRPLVFVVQKHAASHLHYDFRLELDGVLKSWAVPKGPSLNPADKRLAMMVEDHPFDYRTFEGTIPPGNYGAGTVMVWDRGQYHAAGTQDPLESEKQLRIGLHKGRLTFVLLGEKLRGEFSLLKMRDKEENSWLLVKKDDEFAGDEDVTAQDRSVVTGRSLPEIAQADGNEPAPDEPPKIKRAAESRAGHARKGRSPARAGGQSSPKRAKKGTGAKKGPGSKKGRPRVQGSPTPFPHDVEPMLATLIEEPFDKPGWFFEIKWDGYRTLAEIQDGRVGLCSRKNTLLNERFRPVAEALRGFQPDAILDGEVVAVDAEGKASFALLQKYHLTGQGLLIYYVFDLLYYDGLSLMTRPLLERKELLKAILPASPHLQYSDHIIEQGIGLFNMAREKGLEGIIAKEGSSPYQPGVRGDSWLKIKTSQQQEAVIGGFTAPRGGRKGLGALVLGVYQGDDLIYIGHTGGGLNSRQLQDLRSRFEPLITPHSPFLVTPHTNAPVTWVRPELVVEVHFREWTMDNVMRQPIFLGLRDDKDPREVCRERPAPVTGLVPGRLKLLPEKGGAQKPDPAPPPQPPARLTGKLKLLKPEDQDKSAPSGRSGAHKFKNLDKVYWPAEGYTKKDLIDYYTRIAPLILPYLKDRPENLHRFPDGITGESFYQKDVEGHPAWVQTVAVDSESHGKPIHYLVCQDEATLIYLANQGCIEVNPWNSRVTGLDNPDWCVIDLDPLGVGFDQVIRAAQAVRKVLERAGGKSIPKTSGATGLHIFIPLAARYSTDQCVQFAKIVAYLAHQALPDETSVERSPSKRDHCVYLDYLQNRRGQTLACAYSLRPRPGAPVSTPLRWNEVKKGLDPAKFNLKTIFRRLDKVGDLWRDVLGEGIDLDQCLANLGERD